MSCSLPTPRAGRCRSDRVAGHPGNDRRSSLAEGARPRSCAAGACCGGQAAARHLWRVPDAGPGDSRPVRHRRSGRAGDRGRGLGFARRGDRIFPHKVLRLPRGEGLGVPASGYEIHHGGSPAVTPPRSSSAARATDRCSAPCGTARWKATPCASLPARDARPRPVGLMLPGRTRAPPRPARRSRRTTPRRRCAAQPGPPWLPADLALSRSGRAMRPPHLR